MLYVRKDRREPVLNYNLQVVLVSYFCTQWQTRWGSSLGRTAGYLYHAPFTCLYAGILSDETLKSRLYAEILSSVHKREGPCTSPVTYERGPWICVFPPVRQFSGNRIINLVDKDFKVRDDRLMESCVIA